MRNVFLIILIIFSNYAFAEDFKSTFDKTIASGKQLNTDSYNALKKFDPNKL